MGRPGSKVWDVDYRADGQPTGVGLPNGMHTEYLYDARARMTKILHKASSSGSAMESYEYALDKAGLIDSIEHLDGSFWTYDYDARYRLTSAIRSDASEFRDRLRISLRWRAV
jgi:YD repeat-containing protein